MIELNLIHASKGALVEDFLLGTKANWLIHSDDCYKFDAMKGFHLETVQNCDINVFPLLAYVQFLLKVLIVGTHIWNETQSKLGQHRLR